MMQRHLVLIAVTTATILVVAGIMGGDSMRDFVIRLCIYGLFALSLNLLIGYTGLISFGHALFFAGGAYAFVFLMQTGQVSIPVALVGTIAINALIALIVGAICVRTSEIYFAFLTLAFQMMFYNILYAAKPITGGDQGLIGGIPKPVFFGVNLADSLHLYLFVCALTVATTLALWMVVSSSFGHALRMVRDNPERATFLGMNVKLLRLVAFVISAAAGSVAGVLMSLFVSGAYPNFAYWTQSGDAIFMVVIGSTQWFLGPFVGAAFLLLLNDLITARTSHYGLVMGICILVVALGFRKGLLDIAGDHALRLFRGAPKAERA